MPDVAQFYSLQSTAVNYKVLNISDPFVIFLILLVLYSDFSVIPRYRKIGFTDYTKVIGEFIVPATTGMPFVIIPITLLLYYLLFPMPFTFSL